MVLAVEPATVIGANRGGWFPSIVTRWRVAIPGPVLAGPDRAGPPHPVTAAPRRRSS